MGFSWAQIEVHMGSARMAAYVERCNGDQARAVDLYVWNAKLAAAFWLDLGHVEVALRNALDARMTLRSAKHGSNVDWLNDPQRELGRDAIKAGRHKQPFKDIHEARNRVRRNDKVVSHDQVISETSFGLWHQLVSRSQTFLWPDLAGAFPHAPDRAQPTIAEPVSRLRHFRNRIAHHHRIWTLNGRERYEDILRLAGYIEPGLASWIDGHSSVSTLMEGQP